MKSILLSASALLIAVAVSAQSKVTTGGQKHVLLEEGTGTWCGYCPDGSQRIQETIEPNYPRCIAVAFHNGSSDAMTISGDPFNSVYITSFPGGAIDRVPFTHTISGSPVTSVNVNRGFWSTDVGVRNALSPKFDVSMTSTYDSVTRVLNIQVKGKALVAATGNYRINAYIVEDSISSAASGYQQVSYMNATSGSWFMGYGSPISPASRYAHMGVVRNILATGGSIWGDIAFANPAIGDSITKTYTFTIPATYVSKYTKVVGLVQKYGTTTNDREIENSIDADVRSMWKVLPTTSIANAPATLDNVELFPNPAADYINVKGYLSVPTATEITITNTIGQVVAQHQYPAGSSNFSENIQLNDLSAGIYFMNIASNGAGVTKKFVINK